MINLYKYTLMYSEGRKTKLIEGDVFRVNIPLYTVATDKATEQKILVEGEQRIYNMICGNLHLTVK